MTERPCVLRPNAEISIGLVSQGAYQRLPSRCESSWRWAAVVLFQANVQPRLRSLYRYTMCKLIAKPVARTVGASSEPSFERLLERHQPAGGTATPAGVPVGSSVRRPTLVVSESLECAGRILREDSRKGSLLFVVAASRSSAFSRSLSMAMLTSVETSSCAASAALD